MKKIIYLAFIILLIACSPSGKTTKQGMKYEQSGLHEKASDQYYKSVKINPSDIKAIAGLQRTGEIVIEKKVNKFENEFDNKHYESAYKKYLDAQKFKNKLERVGVDVEIPHESTKNFKSTKKILAENHYKAGKRYYENQDWDDAVDEFSDCLKYMPGYKDAKDLLDESDRAYDYEMAEKYYRSGVDNMNRNNYRAAYGNFTKCLSYVSGYKDANDLKEESLNSGKIQIAFLEFKNNSNLRNNEHLSLHRYVVNNAVDHPSVFIDVVDRANQKELDDIIRESMSGMVDEASAADAGKRLGIDYIITGSIINAYSDGGNVRLTQKVNAWEVYTVKGSDGKVKYKGKAVKFNVYEGSTKVTIEAQYQIIDVETGRIIKSEIIKSSDSDYIKYADYNGDHTKLSIYDPNSTDPIVFLLAKGLLGDIDKRWFTSRRTLKKPADLSAPLIKNIGSEMPRKICNYCLEK